MKEREALKILEILKMASIACEAQSDNPAYEKTVEALNIALAALRGPTREQVEKCFGSIWEFDDEDFDYDWHCVKCECPTNVRPNFCPRCGAAMTDEAINILLKRLEALKDETD